MRTTSFLISTLREVPADAETASHRLMLRAGLIRQLAAGIYTWLPPGLRVLRRVEAVIREEMNRSGAQEVLMPMVQPRELWDETGRWDKMGPELLRLADRHAREFCLGPTHEEIITDLVRRDIRSYRQLPANFYQIQTKFRDEVRPRFGVMRSREFIMKDGYSFHLSQDCFERTYREMYDCYHRILDRFGLKFRAVLADSGAIGGETSHEFQVLAESGEDLIAWADGGTFAANIERAPAVAPARSDPQTESALEQFATPGVRTMAELCEGHDLAHDRGVKTLIVHGEDDLLALVIRGDHTLNALKAEKLEGVVAPLRMADDAEIRARLGVSPGSIGPVGLPIPIIADHAARALSGFVAGANEDGVHYRGIDWDRDVTAQVTVADIRNVVEGDPSPDGNGTIRLARGIEVGHIFQLGTVYSASMKAVLQTESGQQQPLIMGCYGMGVSRLVAAIIEQCHDDAGIRWPDAVAPFRLALVTLNAKKSAAVRNQAESLYRACLEAGIDVLLDDRDERPGVKFADMELLGIPHQVVIGDRGLQAGHLEYRRRGGDSAELPLADALGAIIARLEAGTGD